MTAPLPQGPRFPLTDTDRALVELAGMTNAITTFFLQNIQRVGRPVQLPEATVSDLLADPAVFRPAIARVVFCVDLSGTTSGAPVYSDGITWRRFSDNSTVS